MRMAPIMITTCAESSQRSFHAPACILQKLHTHILCATCWLAEPVTKSPSACERCIATTDVAGGRHGGSHQGVLRGGGGRQAAAAAAVQALLGRDGGLLQALRVLPGLLPRAPGAAQGRLRTLLLLLVVLRDALLQVEACSWHGGTCIYPSRFRVSRASRQDVAVIMTKTPLSASEEFVMQGTTD